MLITSLAAYRWAKQGTSESASPPSPPTPPSPFPPFLVSDDGPLSSASDQPTAATTKQRIKVLLIPICRSGISLGKNKTKNKQTKNQKQQQQQQLLQKRKIPVEIKFEDVPLVEFMYLVFTRTPDESYRGRLRSLLYLCYVFRALINSLVC